MADIVDMDELATGQRREGSYTGVFGFIFKMGVAGALPLLGWGVDLVGFDPVLGARQAPETYLKLRLVATFLSAAFASISAVVLLGLPLSPQRAHETRIALEKRRGKASST
jgi:GPH family glycoside/pentoside/hexuronide:cation symporter